MTNLSPAAQAVLATYEKVWGQGYGSPLAAALRAAVERLGFQDDYGTRLINVDDLLATINELENQ